MIILSRNIDTAQQGHLAAGTDVEGLLPDHVVQDLLDRKWAHRVSESEQQAAEPETDEDDLNPEGSEEPQGDSEPEGNEESESESEHDDEDVIVADEETLSKFKVADLKEIANETGIEGFDQMKKAELIAAIIQAANQTKEGDAE